MIATVPVPVKVVLKTPPASIEAPSTRLMSHSSVESKASTLLPLTVRESPSRRTRWISEASSARKTSPRPDTRIRGMPSPVSAFFKNLLIPPAPW